MFNQHIDDTLRYHWLTFENLEVRNREAVEQNIHTTRGHAFDFAMRVVSTITTVLEEPDFKRIKPSQAQVDPPRDDLKPAA